MKKTQLTLNIIVIILSLVTVAALAVALTACGNTAETKIVGEWEYKSGYSGYGEASIFFKENGRVAVLTRDNELLYWVYDNGNKNYRVGISGDNDDILDIYIVTVNGDELTMNNDGTIARFKRKK